MGACLVACSACFANLERHAACFAWRGIASRLCSDPSRLCSEPCPLSGLGLPCMLSRDALLCIGMFSCEMSFYASMSAGYEGGGGGGLSRLVGHRRLLEHRRLVQDKQGLCLDVSGCLCRPLDVCGVISRLSSLVSLSLGSLSLVSRLSRLR